MSRLVKKCIFKRHYRVKHSAEYSKYTVQERLKIFEELRLVYSEDDNTHNSFFNSVSNTDNNDAKTFAASYAILFLIAKRSKSFNNGEFIKINASLKQQNPSIN